MKIAIIGYSGSGKTTLARILSKIYKIDNVLHMDSIHFDSNWVEVEKSISIDKLNNFLDTNDDWIIEGNYFGYGERRFIECDLLVFLNYNRIKCLKGVLARHKTYLNKEREEIPGCIDKIDLEFLNWVLFKGRTKKRRKNFKNAISIAKNVKVFKNRDKLLDYIEKLNDEENEKNSGFIE